MGDYEIRAQEPSDLAKSYGMDYPMYVVWDVVNDKAVPFGRHRSPDRAASHVERLRNRACQA
ncbi:hypothetical protein [Streptomyces lycii]|uniref:Uncharacterized protein n=1 Tax=Streptomyces lycii TaxID=2654337 RepID=A0ABQ7FJT8_9ACTN|nr:hypothetical protein [Streptomyces lycii]KAF4408629.1 hypothetical protein GCU69_13095 [Streptomyces lycii]